MLKVLLSFAAAITAGRAFAKSYSDSVTVLGDTVAITQEAAQSIKGEGLATILMQAAATPVFKGGMQIGYRLTDIDQGSVYETVGLRNGDVVLSVEEMPLSSPRRSVEILRYAKGLDSFTVEIMRHGVRQTIYTVVTN